MIMHHELLCQTAEDAVKIAQEIGESLPLSTFTVVIQ